MEESLVKRVINGTVLCVATRVLVLKTKSDLFHTVWRLTRGE